MLYTSIPRYNYARWLHLWLHFGAKILPFLMEKSGSILVSGLFSVTTENPPLSAIFYLIAFGVKACTATIRSFASIEVLPYSVTTQLQNT